MDFIDHRFHLGGVVTVGNNKIISDRGDFINLDHADIKCLFVVQCDVRGLCKILGCVITHTVFPFCLFNFHFFRLLVKFFHELNHLGMSFPVVVFKELQCAFRGKPCCGIQILITGHADLMKGMGKRPVVPERFAVIRRVHSQFHRVHTDIAGTVFLNRSKDHTVLDPVYGLCQIPAGSCV